MYNHFKKLSAHEISTLRKHCTSLKFNSDFDLVYESQIPNTALVLINGEISFFRNEQLEFKINPGNMIGIYELINNQPTQFRWKVKSDSELIMIQKSELLSAVSDKRSKLFEIIKEVL